MRPGGIGNGGIGNGTSQSGKRLETTPAGPLRTQARRRARRCRVTVLREGEGGHSPRDDSDRAALAPTVPISCSCHPALRQQVFRVVGCCFGQWPGALLATGKPPRANEGEPGRSSVQQVPPRRRGRSPTYPVHWEAAAHALLPTSLLLLLITARARSPARQHPHPFRFAWASAFLGPPRRWGSGGAYGDDVHAHSVPASPGPTHACGSSFPIRPDAVSSAPPSSPVRPRRAAPPW